MWARKKMGMAPPNASSTSHTTRRSHMKRLAIGLIAGIGLALCGAGPAQAGEINGNGDPIPGAHNASSACAFSGRDLPDAEENQPNIPDDFVTNGHVQSYGKYVSHGLKGVVPSPGEACRGNAEPPPE
jgi:hypothetical protein